jgi:hypothetical protein
MRTAHGSVAARRESLCSLAVDAGVATLALVDCDGAHPATSRHAIAAKQQAFLVMII